MEANRQLTIEGAYNVRDLGGYPTAGGGQTRWRAFLRADSLHKLPPSSQARLVEYGVGTVIDLRRTRETVETPNVFADSTQVRYLHINMIGDTEPPGYGAEPENVKDPAWRSLSYQILLDHRKEAIREILSTLTKSKDSTALFHCAGGTDRTGIIAALLLGIAGVDHDTIAQDYGDSAEALRMKILDEGLSPSFPEITEEDLTPSGARKALAPPEAMSLTLQYLDDRYGGAEGYVRHVGLTEVEVGDIKERMLG